MTRAYISSNAGQRYLLASSDITWTLREGVHPNIEEFDMMPGDPAHLETTDQPITLFIGTLEVKFLYVIGTRGGDNPNIERVVLADRRWWWKYKFVRRFYNMRRNIGVMRIPDPSSSPQALATIPKIAYQPWTLRDKTIGADPKQARWLSREVLNDILDSISHVEPGTPPKNVVGDPQIILQNLDIEDVMINSQGDAAMQTALGFLPEIGLYVDYDGKIRLFSRASGAEQTQIANAGPPIVGGGMIAKATKKNIRPKRVIVYFNYEPEVRFDFDEVPSTRLDTDRYADNVLPLPDFSNSALPSTDASDEKSTTRTECQGTWITMSEAFTAFGAAPGFSGNLTHQYVQKAMVPFVDLWGRIGSSGRFVPDADWVSRVSAIMQHYRRTYRINRVWVDNYFSIKPYRVATVNQATGTRAPAIAYADHCYLPSQRSFFNELIMSGNSNANDYSYCINVKSHPATVGQLANTRLNTKSKPAPAKVHIVDSDQGIIHLDYTVDEVRMFEAVLPSMMTMSDHEDDRDANGLPKFAGPSADVTQRGRPITFDTISSANLTSVPKLTANHSMSAIFTVIPGAPNDERALFAVIIEASDKNLSKKLPLGVRRGLENASGPDYEVWIGPNIETARMPWIDGDEGHPALVQELFGIGGDALQRAEAFSKRTQSKILNYERSFSGAASLNILALAAAARVYASFSDRYVGEMTAGMTGSVRPDGWLSEVSHTLAPNGVMTTHLGLPDQMASIDLMAFLPGDVRGMILKRADPGIAS